METVLSESNIVSNRTNLQEPENIRHRKLRISKTQGTSLFTIDQVELHVNVFQKWR